MIQIVTYGIGTPQQSYMPTATPLAIRQGRAVSLRRRQGEGVAGRGGLSQRLRNHLYGARRQRRRRRAAPAAAADVGPIGVKLKIEQLDNATRDAKYRADDFQMRTSAWTNDINDPSEITLLSAIIRTSSPTAPAGTTKRSTSLFEQSQEEIEPAKRAAIYKEIQERYERAAPIVFLLRCRIPSRCEEGAGLRADPARQ